MKWPRTKEERWRQRDCGIAAYISRAESDIGKAGASQDKYPYKVGLSKECHLKMECGIYMEEREMATNQNATCNSATRDTSNASFFSSVMEATHFGKVSVTSALGVKETLDNIQEFVRTYPSDVKLALQCLNAVDTSDLHTILQYYKSILKLKPTLPNAYLNLGNNFNATGMDHEEAGNIKMEWNMTSNVVSDHKATLVVTTGLSSTLNNLDLVYKRQGIYADAISCFNEIFCIDSMAANGLVSRRNTYKKIGIVSDAIQDCMQAISTRPTMAEAHVHLGLDYRYCGHLVWLRKYGYAIILSCVIAIWIFVTFSLATINGIAVAVLEMFSTIASGLFDVHGHINDKAGGITELACMTPIIQERTGTIDVAVQKWVKATWRIFYTIFKLMEGTTKPNNATCAKISANISIKELNPPSDVDDGECLEAQSYASNMGLSNERIGVL
ncbi:Inorganic H pyrophosphatase family protein [Euphorbia peplus]|nr:Inorganic H pyrophosphatase family protein [Euphorbia peplus]